MTSLINYDNIDANYPIAGQDNDTQGFRDNFTNIKDSLHSANTEISDLQAKGIFKSALTGTTLDNNMQDNLIHAVKLRDVSFTKNTISYAAAVNIDYSAGQYQLLTLSSGQAVTTTSFSNWPSTGDVGVVSLIVNVTSAGTPPTLTLPASVNSGITIVPGVSPGTVGVSNTITFYNTGVYIFEFFTYDAGTNIAIKTIVTPVLPNGFPQRVNSQASASTITPDVNTYDLYAINALAGNLAINAPTGSPVDGTRLTFRILDNGTSRTLTWNGTYTVIGVTLPTSTTINKTTYVGCIYNANNTRWDVIAVTTQA